MRHLSTARLSERAIDFLSTGDPVVEPKRWLLLDGERHEIELPLDAGAVGSIVLDREDAGFRVRALRAEEDLVLTATPATSCTP